MLGAGELIERFAMSTPEPNTQNPTRLPLLHVPGGAHVSFSVSAVPLSLCLLSVSLYGATSDLAPLLKTVENRYNRAQTLQVVFHEAYTGPGEPRQTESGTLLLRKPGRMRWDYTSPQGKLFLSDGKFLWLYTPSDNHVEKIKMQGERRHARATRFLAR